ncbi:MAG: SBBP repeat-containing protein [Planctomycetia bacterium]|nr:MAG: SBBP repeat-containing protein [Planctomycetia bacterium]
MMMSLWPRLIPWAVAPAASSIPRTWGGYYYNIGSGIAVDGSGNAYVTGATWSDDFPTTPSAYQGTITAGAKDGNVFVTKINTLGSGTSSLVYSTYLGGSGSEEGKGIAVDGSGNAYITGNTSSSDFPTTPSAYKGTTDDVFVAKIDTLGSGASSLVYSTYLGGSDGELGSGIAVDGSGNAYITGLTDSTNFPTTPSAYQGNLIGYADVFVTKIDTLGSGTSSLVYSTYLGGTFMDYGQGIAVDGSGNAYITGLTDSTNFPTTPSAYQGTLQGTYYGDRDAFVSKLSLPPELPNAITLVYFHASAGKDGSVTLTWETATEVDNAGFNLYRSRKKDGDYKKINDTLIPAMGNATTGAKYSYTDTPPAKGTYYYKLEDVDYNGISTMHGQEKVKVKIMSGDAGTKKSKRKKGR